MKLFQEVDCEENDLRRVCPRVLLQRARVHTTGRRGHPTGRKHRFSHGGGAGVGSRACDPFFGGPTPLSGELYGDSRVPRRVHDLLQRLRLVGLLLFGRPQLSRYPRLGYMRRLDARVLGFLFSSTAAALPPSAGLPLCVRFRRGVLYRCSQQLPGHLRVSV